ncbi:hypothetical protein Tco_0814002 [Tanacetum coccineum]
MNVINMSMRQVQVNTKFLNSLPPEWSKFMTDVKLARDLHTTNYDQLYSYLEQHKAHANEIRLMRERYQDPLAFAVNYNQSPSQLNNYHSQYNTTQFSQQTNTMIPQIHSPQSYSLMYPPPHPSQPQISHSSIPPSQQYQSHQTSSVPPIAYNTQQSLTQPLTEFPQMDSGLVVPVFNQGDDPIACLNKAMAYLTAVASSIFLSTKINLELPLIRETKKLFKTAGLLSGGNNVGGQAKVVKCYYCQGEDGQAAQTTISNIAAFQTKDLDVYDSDCDDVTNAKAVLMANLSNYGSDVISEQIDSLEQNLSNQIKEKESLLQTFTVFKNESKEKESKYMDKEIDLEKKIKELDNIVYKVGQYARIVHMLTKPQVFYDDTHKQALGYQNPFYLKKAQRIKPTLYDGSVISTQHAACPMIDDEETLILEEVSRSKMLAKQNDPMSKENKVNTTPIDYVELN